MTEPGPLTAAEIWEEFEGEPPTLSEAVAIVPKKGKLFFPATDPKTGHVAEGMKIAVIRPCVSRGKRLHGLPPIYTGQMLAANAGVFTDWPMYEDHLAEQAVEGFREQLAEANMGDVLEFLEERARRIKELGGRVIESYYNPEMSFATDKDEGYQRGGIEAVVIPQPGIKAMLEADPGILHNSINAWPTAAKPGSAPWSPETKGMVIEGIRKKPRGSVDYVFRGGAGGRPILEEDRAVAVTMLEAFYAAEHDASGPLADADQALMTQLKDLKPDQLREFLSEEAPHLVEALAPKPAGSGGGSGEGDALTADAVREMLAEQRQELETSFEEKLEERDEEVETQVAARLEERTQAERLSAVAEAKISEAVRNGLPKDWANDLRRRYTVLPSGPTAGLILQEADLKDDEDKDITPDAAIEARVREDVAHCSKLIESAGGTPLIRGAGPSSPDPGGETTPASAPVQNRFRSWLAESGDFDDLKENETADDRVKSMTAGGGR